MKCYCQYNHGGNEKNGIICKTEQGNETSTSCDIHEGCTGTTSEINAIGNPKLLCEKGISTFAQYGQQRNQTNEIFAKYINVSFPCYFLGCGDTPFEIRQIPFTGVEIKSKNYPSIHPNNVACSNVVRLNKGQRVRLTFLDFELEGSEGKWLVVSFNKCDI